MDWLVFAATVPGPAEFGTLGWMSFAALVAALAPLGLVARQVLRLGTPEAERSPLHVIEGGRELSRRAA